MTFDDFRRRISDVLFDAWATEAGYTEADLRRFFADGVPADLAAAIDDTFAGAWKVSDWPKVIPGRHRTAVLHKRLRSSTVKGDNMDADHRIAISRGAKKDPFQRAITDRGYTQNKLAKAIGINPAVLSLHRNKLRRIPRSRAEAIQKLTGWPADARHWPCGIVTDGE